MTQRPIHLHLISDSTGETVHQTARAALAQFSDRDITEHIWTLIRSIAHVDTFEASLKRNPGIVLYSVVDPEIRTQIEERCRQHSVPSLSILDPLVDLFSEVFGEQKQQRPGAQHQLDRAYFKRMAAVEFAVNHDDGMNMSHVGDADILLVGVSRTSKTPTSMYLANRGYRVANYALVPNVPFPIEYLSGKKPFVVGLTTDPKRLIQVRRNRLEHMRDNQNDSYADLDQVSGELRSARRLFASHNWPVLDVSRRSIEETAASIIHLYTKSIEAGADDT